MSSSILKRRWLKAHIDGRQSNAGRCDDRDTAMVDSQSDAAVRQERGRSGSTTQ